MNNKKAKRAVWGGISLFSAMLLANSINGETLHPSAATDSAIVSTSSSTAQNSPTLSAVTANATEDSFALTNQHANLGVESATNHSMGSAISDAALAASIDETGSTSTNHILRMPAGLDETTAAKWLVVAKKEATADYQKTGRSQQIIQVAATTPTLSFAIGNTSVPSVDAVDVASFQSWMSQSQYTQLKQLGVKAVIVKVSEGSTYANPYAADQIKYAQKAGLKVAVYHYARFGNAATATAEAKKTAATMQSLGLAKSTLIFADMEASETNTSNVATNLNAYWSSLNAAGYTNHGVYTGGLFGSSYAAATSGTVGAAKTWYAQYPYTPSKNNLWNTQYGAWQFSSTAYLPGFAGNDLDTSVDYKNLFGSVAKPYDTIKSTKTINLPGTINQTSRADGFYSAPYNTNAATATPNSNGKAFNGQTVQVLEEATTSRSAASGNTFYKIRFVNGKTYWTDTRAVKLSSFYTMTNKHAVSYTAQINEAGRNDGLYPDGPYKTKLTNIYQNTNAPAYNKEIVPVSEEATTPTGTYCQIKLTNGQIEWIDKRGLTIKSAPSYDKIKSQKSLSLIGKINQSGRADGLYSAPYNTDALTVTENHNAKAFNGQKVEILAEAVTTRSAKVGNDFYEIKLSNGRTLWIDKRGVTIESTPSYDKIKSQKSLSLIGKINQSGRADGLYSAPYNTDALTVTENHNAKAFNGQKVEILAEAVTTRSAKVGNDFYEIKLSNGRTLWIDKRGVTIESTPSYDKIKSQKSMSLIGKINQSGRADGLYSAPYNTDALTVTENHNAKAFNGQKVEILAEAVTTRSAKVGNDFYEIKLSNGRTLWIDSRGVKLVPAESVKNSKTVSFDAKINETGRKDGLYAHPFNSAADSIFMNTDAVKYNGRGVKVTAEGTTSQGTYAKVTLPDKSTKWIDVRALVKITYNKVTSTKQLSSTGKINQTGRADGLYSAPYYTDAMTVLENHNARSFNGQTVKVLKQAKTNRSAVTGNTFDEIQLSNGKIYWIDSRGVTINK